MNYSTEADWNIYDAEAEREHGPSGNSEIYYRENSLEADSIAITTREREDFESETDIELDADVISTEQFDKLLAWIKEGGLLHEDQKD